MVSILELHLHQSTLRACCGGVEGAKAWTVDSDQREVVVWRQPSCQGPATRRRFAAAEVDEMRCISRKRFKRRQRSFALHLWMPLFIVYYTLPRMRAFPSRLELRSHLLDNKASAGLTK
jgi:hypothetical protein